MAVDYALGMDEALEVRVDEMDLVFGDDCDEVYSFSFR